MSQKVWSWGICKEGSAYKVVTRQVSVRHGQESKGSLRIEEMLESKGNLSDYSDGLRQGSGCVMSVRWKIWSLARLRIYEGIVTHDLGLATVVLNFGLKGIVSSMLTMYIYCV